MSREVFYFIFIFGCINLSLCYFKYCTCKQECNC